MIEFFEPIITGNRAYTGYVESKIVPTHDRFYGNTVDEQTTITVFGKRNDATFMFCAEPELHHFFGDHEAQFQSIVVRCENLLPEVNKNIPASMLGKLVLQEGDKIRLAHLNTTRTGLAKDFDGVADNI